MIRNNQSASKLIRVGLIGEDPHDTESVRHLLERRFPNRLTFVTLGKRLKGSQLDTLKHLNIVCAELEDQSPRLVVVIRDLDGPASDAQKRADRQRFFDEINACCNNRALFLLNIEEVEALLLCDLAPFNQRYKTKATYRGDPIKQRKPKEWMLEKSKYRYVERDCLELFKKINIETLEEKCVYYREFIEEFILRLRLTS